MRVKMMRTVEITKGKSSVIYHGNGTFDVADELGRQWCEERKAYKDGDDPPAPPPPELKVRAAHVVSSNKTATVPTFEPKPEPKLEPEPTPYVLDPPPVELDDADDTDTEDY